MPSNPIESAEKDILNFLGEEATKEFYTNQNATINHQNLQRIIIDKTGKLILVEGDIKLFNEVLTTENLQLIFEQNIGFMRSGDALIICRSQSLIDDMELSELVYITPDMITKSIDDLKPLGIITNAEYSLLLDLLTGLSTKETALKDGASYHTRRNQVKSLTEKLSVSGQTELIRNVIASMFSVAFKVKEVGDVEAKDVAGEYLDKVILSAYRFHKIQLPDNETIRAIDFGPIGGDPVIICHGSFLSFFPSSSDD